MKTPLNKKVATKVRKEEDGAIVVRYHSTDIVTIRPCGRVILRTGGWRTVTTKRRMNQTADAYGLNFYVWQKNYQWFINFEGKDYNFVEGMVLIPGEGVKF